MKRSYVGENAIKKIKEKDNTAQMLCPLFVVGQRPFCVWSGKSILHHLIKSPKLKVCFNFIREMLKIGPKERHKKRVTTGSDKFKRILLQLEF